MKWSIGFGLERIGLAVLAAPKIASAVFLFVLLGMGLSLPKLSFDDDIHRAFLSDSPVSEAQRTYEAAQTPKTTTVLVHAAKTAVFTPADLSLLRDLSLDIELAENVLAVASPFSLRLPLGPGGVQDALVFGSTITPNYPSHLTAFRALETGLPTFINDTHTALMFSVIIDADAAPIATTVAQLHRELARIDQTGMTLTLTGEDAISVEIVNGLKADLISLNIWGSLIVTFAAFLVFRELRMTLIVVLPALSGAIGVLALSVWLGYPITVTSNVIPILVLVLGVADGVHLTSHLKRGGPGKASIADTVRTIGPACALTAITTSAAFASIMISSNVQLFEFALLGMIGTLIAFVLTITAFVLLALALPMKQTGVPQIGARFAGFLTARGRAAPRVTIVLCAALLTFTAWGFAQTKAWFPLYQNLPGSSQTRSINDAIANNFGGVFQLIIETDGSWDTLTNLVANLEDAAPDSVILSEVNIARYMDKPNRRPSVEQMAQLPSEIARQLRPNPNVSRVFVSIPEPMRSTQTLEQFDTLIETAQISGADRIFGLPLIMRREAVSLIQQLSTGLVFAAIGATALVALAFQSLRLVPILFVPNILPLVITGASLHLWASGELTPTAVLALTIAFGIAIDDTVHFLGRYVAAKKNGSSIPAAVQSAAASAGQVMVLTTLLLTAGLAVTLISDFTPIRLFGAMMMLTLWTALLVDLLLLPAVLTLKRTSQ